MNVSGKAILPVILLALGFTAWIASSGRDLFAFVPPAKILRIVPKGPAGAGIPTPTSRSAFTPHPHSRESGSAPDENIANPHSTPGYLTSAEQARTILSPALREEATRRAIQAWATEDPAAALAWAAKLPDPHESTIALIQACTQIAETDPASAIRLAMDHHLDEIPGDLLGNFTASWAARDLPAARDWVAAQSPGDLRDTLIERIAFESAKTDPAAAAKLVADEISNGDSQTEAAISVVHQWFLLDPQAATAWVENFPDATLRERAAGELEQR